MFARRQTSISSRRGHTIMPHSLCTPSLGRSKALAPASSISTDCKFFSSLWLSLTHRLFTFVFIGPLPLKILKLSFDAMLFCHYFPMDLTQFSHCQNHQSQQLKTWSWPIDTCILMVATKACVALLNVCHHHWSVFLKHGGILTALIFDKMATVAA